MKYKFYSWNVNGLRACVGKGFLDFFNETDADFFSLQETKLQPEQINLELKGYKQYWHSAVKKGYSGTAVFTKYEPINVFYGMDNYIDDEGRVMTLEFEKFFLVNSYVPNSKEKLARLDYRMDFEDKMREHIQNLSKTKPVVFCGDLNVAHKEIDLKNPKTNRQNPGFSDEEREKFTKLLESGNVDTFRHLYPELENAYTWWSYRFSARTKDIGWRIDYFVVSKDLENCITKSEIHKNILGSDHCPISLEIEI